MTDWVTRGTSYCGKIRLGDATAQLPLGNLDFAEFTSVQLEADNLGALSLLASFETNHQVSVSQQLFEGAEAQGGDCVGGTQLGSPYLETAASASHTWSSQAAMPLKRGEIYCVKFVAND